MWTVMQLSFLMGYSLNSSITENIKIGIFWKVKQLSNNEMQANPSLYNDHGRRWFNWHHASEEMDR